VEGGLIRGGRQKPHASSYKKDLARGKKKEVTVSALKERERMGVKEYLEFSRGGVNRKNTEGEVPSKIEQLRSGEEKDKRPTKKKKKKKKYRCNWLRETA